MHISYRINVLVFVFAFSILRVVINTLKYTWLLNGLLLVAVDLILEYLFSLKIIIVDVFVQSALHSTGELKCFLLIFIHLYFLIYYHSI